MLNKIDLFKAINRVENPDNMTDLEKQHDITIRVSNEIKANVPFDVELIVGDKDPHPNDPGHFIQYIELYSRDSLVSRYEMPAVTINTPSIRVTIQLPRWAAPELVVRTRCNLHGIWEARKRIWIS